MPPLSTKCPVRRGHSPAPIHELYERLACAGSLEVAINRAFHHRRSRPPPAPPILMKSGDVPGLVGVFLLREWRLEWSRSYPGRFRR